ncbi:MAG: VCBS repeat-containing protein, partial [Bacteroidia bacterium]|nr:VCBS repeat-containing protein [Bacteroidia bacterium]
MHRLRVILIIASLCFSSCTSKENKSDVKKDEDIQLFTKIPYTESGVDFINKLTQNVQVNILTFKYFFNGGGVALGDINNDGLVDLYFTGNIGPNRLFLNKGNFKFVDITQAAGVDGSRGWANGATMVDINNDGFLDIYVCRSGAFEPVARANQLFINNGNNTFTNRAAEYGLNDMGYSTHATFFDYDLDGDLDMYLLNHNVVFTNDRPIEELKNTADKYVGDKLYKNENGKFIDASKEAGIKQPVISYGLGVGVGDLNSDGFPDIYVCNDFTERDYMYINNGDGTFSETLKSSTGHTSNFSMGVDIADFNNDGLSDILVADMAAEDNYRSKTNMSGMNPEKFWKAVDGGFHYQYMVNTLQLNRGENKFSEIGQLAGIPYTDWSWSPLFADLDNDGWKDIFITNGYRRASRNNDFIKQKEYYFKQIEEDPNVNQAELIQKILSLMPEDKLPNYVYKNNGDLTFTKKSGAWGVGELSYSNGSAMADLDNDGDLDLVINNIDEASTIYRNNAEQFQASNYLKIKLKGSKNNRQGIGSTVTISSIGSKQKVEFYPSRGYLSCMEDLIHFGLADNKRIEELEIKWPDGKKQVLKDVKSNQLLTLSYSDATQGVNNTPKRASYFSNITGSSKINFKHIENKYDDFKDEILIPHKMSTLGPCLAIADVNGDGLDDFYIGGARNQSGELFIQSTESTFTSSGKSVWNNDKRHEDMGAAFFDVDSDGDVDLYVGSGGSEEADGSAYYKDRLYLNDGNGNFSKSRDQLPGTSISSSCVMPYDFDKDGDLDLFVGGRMIPGKYPFPASSKLLRNNNGVFKDVTNDLAPELSELGMVTSALWTDINNDKQMDLIVTGEWMPITIFINENNKFSKSRATGIENATGWWFSLSEADIDGDGDKDMIAGNLGLNYKYKTSVLEPFQVYCHDFDSNGTLDIYLGYFQQGKLFPVRGRECSTQQMPFVSEKFGNYDAFGKATLPEVLGEQTEQALHYEAKTFATSIIENNGDGTFKLIELPAEAQFSSVNGIVVDDINNDSHPDLILAGNLFGSEVETPRNDASIGCVLLNNGKGEFRSLTLE